MIEVESASVTRDKKEILRQIDLNVDSGESVALLGHNGAGKTTLIKVIAKLIEPESGTVSTTGTMGYVPDSNGFYSRLTILDNLAFRASLAGMSRNDAMGEISRLMDEFGLKEVREKVSSSLSQGMARRLAICCALVSRPNVILLDEPMNGLDPIASEMMENAIKSWAREGKSVLISSHDLHSVVHSCDRGYILRKGSAVWSGPVAKNYEELKKAYFRFADE